MQPVGRRVPEEGPRSGLLVVYLAGQIDLSIPPGQAQQWLSSLSPEYDRPDPSSHAQ